jgi:hypothetical protein
LLDRADVFAPTIPRAQGGLFDHLATLLGPSVAAPAALREVLVTLGPIWPSRLSLGGVALGDTWKHSAIRRSDPTAGLVPLHKLSQWLMYSLIEPMTRAGVAVTDLDGLTGLAEYRNGGLFIDTGVLTAARSVAERAACRGLRGSRRDGARSRSRCSTVSPGSCSTDRRARGHATCKHSGGRNLAAGRRIAQQKEAGMADHR